MPFLGDVFDLIGNKLCFRDGCPAGQENFNGLCYTPCAAGFKSDGIAPYMCYKQCTYPDYEANGLLHTALNITKRLETVLGHAPSQCPPGMERDGALCYRPCRAGYKGVGPVCWADTTKVNVAGRIPNKAPCPSSMRDDGTSCWDDVKCETGYFGGRLRGAFGEDWGPKLETRCSGSGRIERTLFQRQSCGPNEDLIDGLCYNKCPAGTSHVPGAPYDCRTNGELSYTRDVGAPLVCPAGQVQDGALCYDPKPGYSLLASTYSQQCPAGSKDIGVACEREHYNRGIGTVPLVIRMKPRL